MSWIPTVDLTTAVVVAANVLGGAMALPQATKMLRHRSIDGVSPAWAGISAAVNGWWAAYGIGTHTWGIVPVSVFSVFAYLVIATTIVRYTRVDRSGVLRSMIGAPLVLSLLPVIAVITAGWVATGVALGVLYGVQLSPAVVTVYRCADVSGVSAATWLIAFTEAALWGLYGLPERDIGMVALASTGLVMSTLVLVRLVIRRPRRATRHIGVGGFAPA